MAVSTFDELKSAIKDWLERNDVDARAEDWIMFAEKQISRDLRSRKMEDREFLTTTANQRYYPLPLNYLEQRDFHIEVSGRTLPLTSLTPKAVDGNSSFDSVGTPTFYSIHGNEIELSPTPDDAYRIEMTYFEKPMELSSTNQTNTYITEFPDLMLYAALLNAEAFLMNDQRVQLWSEAYKSIVDQENRNAKSGRHGAAPAMHSVGNMIV